jgi:hypothetical protein
MTMRLLLRSALCGAFLLASAFAQISQPGGGSGGTTITNTNVATNDVACWNGSNYVNCKPGQSQNVQSGTTYTIVSGDNTKVIQLTNSSAKTITVPDATTAGFESGFFVDVCNANTGAATFNRSSTNTIDGATSTSLSAATTTAPLCFRLNSDGSNWRTSQRGASSGTGGSGVGNVWGFTVNGQVTASTTTFGPAIGGSVGGSGVFSTTEGDRATPIPASCTARNLRVYTNGAQSGTGTLAVTLRTGALGSMADTSVTLTIAAGAAANVFSDTTNSASLTGGQLVSLKFVQGTGASANIVSYSFQCN